MGIQSLSGGVKVWHLDVEEEGGSNQVFWGH